MASLAPVIFPQFCDNNGRPLAGGKIYTYLAGSSTKTETYSDSSGTPNTNPIILDGGGRCRLWLSNSTTYKFVLTDKDDVSIREEDNVSAASSSGGGSDPGAWSQHAITDGQAATDLAGETLDLSLYSSGTYDVEIIRGTTVFSNMPGGLAIQNVNGTGRLLINGAMALEDNGVTFSISQVGTVVQLRAATDTGAGAGTIKLSLRRIPVSA